jgi:hypothetical protein
MLFHILLTELSPSWEAANCAAIQKIPRNFKEPGGSSPCSQEPSIGPYPEPFRSSPYHPITALIFRLVQVICLCIHTCRQMAFEELHIHIKELKYINPSDSQFNYFTVRVLCHIQRCPKNVYTLLMFEIYA